MTSAAPTSPTWRAHAGTPFTCQKRPAFGSTGMVVTNHPLASAAGAEIIAAGGNAVDAAITGLFALSVVEPMMVGILGGGMAHIRLPDGSHRVLDNLSTAPAGATPTMYRPTGVGLEAEGRANMIGATSMAVPGNLFGWCEALERFGTISLADAVAPARRLAAGGFRVTHYLAACIQETAADLLRDPILGPMLVPDGTPLPAGSILKNPAYAETLAALAQHGPDLLRSGALGTQVADAIQRAGGILTAADIAASRVITRDVVRGSYRGVEVVGPPPPASGGVHVVQMLNFLQGFDIAASGFGTVPTLHRIAEALKMAFADRNAATADPDFLEVPVARLIDPAYAAERRAEFDPAHARVWGAGVLSAESPNTTHVTTADANGMVVSSTQTINSLFGARFAIPGTGLIANNYMALFDPTPGRALSIAPGKRVTTSQAPLILLRDGKPWAALGLPGGLRIFGSAMQAVLNLVDHGMSLQEAVEAPRLWTQGGPVEVEDSIPAAVQEGLSALGHTIHPLPHIGGGMNAIRFHADGLMEGAACWRADGTPIGLGGGLAREGTRFWPDMSRPR